MRGTRHSCGNGQSHPGFMRVASIRAFQHSKSRASASLISNRLQERFDNIAGPYESYEGSPVSKGQLQPDMWGVTPSDRWDWAGMRQSIAQHGLRNSLLCAPMPTASTSQVSSHLLFPATALVYLMRHAVAHKPPTAHGKDHGTDQPLHKTHSCVYTGLALVGLLPKRLSCQCRAWAALLAASHVISASHLACSAQ